jgi:hypothetical protein
VTRVSLFQPLFSRPALFETSFLLGHLLAESFPMLFGHAREGFFGRDVCVELIDVVVAAPRVLALFECGSSHSEESMFLQINN